MLLIQSTSGLGSKTQYDSQTQNIFKKMKHFDKKILNYLKTKITKI